MQGGYVGKVLRVDLTRGVIKEEPINEQWAKEFIGARGYATKIMYEEVPATTDPLSSSNKLIFATGPLTGTSSPTGGRYDVVTLGPLTGRIAASNSGGFFGPELKFAGFDFVIIEGKAEHPVYLWINNGKAEIRDAKHLWGKDVFEATDTIVKELGDEHIKVACIGQAGENLVRFAAVMNDKYRAAGRSGVGAVMGSKNLKAIAVRGNNRVKIANPDMFKETLKNAIEVIKANAVTGQGLPTYGTMVLNNIINTHGLYPTNNFQFGQFSKVENVSGEKLKETYLIKNTPCYACPIGCGRVVKTPDGEYGEGPEYETSWAFSADCGVDDLIAVIKASNLCNRYGLDSISTGTTIAAAMELYEKGYIKKEELQGGPEIGFGNSEAITYYTEAIALRKGIGDKLAEGSLRFARAYGHEEFSMSVKGQELPAYDPRGAQGHGLEYATSNRGGCHVRGYMISPEILGIPEKLDPFDTKDKAYWVKLFQDLTAVIDAEGLCLFTHFALGLPHYTDLLNAVTGFNFSQEELLKAGERIYNIERVYNYKTGLPIEDTLPARLLKEPMPEGPAKGNTVKLDVMLPEYYEKRGWTESGIPTDAKLKELGL